MKSLFSSLIILVLCAAALPTEAARPTLRNLRRNALNLEESRRSAYGNIIKADLKAEIFQNEFLGFSAQYPEDWESSYVSGISIANEVIYFAPKNKHVTQSSLFAYVKTKSEAVTMEDLKTDFDEFSRQPENDFEIRTLRNIHELKLKWDNFQKLADSKEFENNEKTIKPNKRHQA